MNFFVAIYLKTSRDVFKFFLSTESFSTILGTLGILGNVFKFKFCLKTRLGNKIFLGHLFENVTWRPKKFKFENVTGNVFKYWLKVCQVLPKVARGRAQPNSSPEVRFNKKMGPNQVNSSPEVRFDKKLGPNQQKMSVLPQKRLLGLIGQGRSKSLRLEVARP